MESITHCFDGVRIETLIILLVLFRAVRDRVQNIINSLSSCPRPGEALRAIIINNLSPVLDQRNRCNRTIISVILVSG